MYIKDDREKSIAWWNQLTIAGQMQYVELYFPNRVYYSMTGREIQEIWQKTGRK